MIRQGFVVCWIEQALPLGERHLAGLLRCESGKQVQHNSFPESGLFTVKVFQGGSEA